MPWKRIALVVATLAVLVGIGWGYRQRRPRGAALEQLELVPLARAADFVSFPLSLPIRTPVSLAPWHGDDVLVCNYRGLYRLHLGSGK